MEKTQVTTAPKTVELQGDAVEQIIPKAGAPSAPGSEQQTFLRLQGVTVDRPSGVIYEVYLNLPAGMQEPSSDSPHFVGVMSLFGSAPDGKELRDDTHAHHGGGTEGGEEFVFDVTEVVVALARESVDLSKLNVTVVPRGSFVEGKPRKVETDATVNIAKITLETTTPEQPAQTPTPSPTR